MRLVFRLQKINKHYLISLNGNAHRAQRQNQKINECRLVCQCTEYSSPTLDAALRSYTPYTPELFSANLFQTRQIILMS